MLRLEPRVLRSPREVRPFQRLPRFSAEPWERLNIARTSLHRAKAAVLMRPDLSASSESSHDFYLRRNDDQIGVRSDRKTTFCF